MMFCILSTKFNVFYNNLNLSLSLQAVENGKQSFYPCQRCPVLQITHL